MTERFKDLWKKNWIWSACAFGLPFVVSVVICAIAGIYPFGENCILHIDMYHQYCPFFMEFREKLTEGASLLYSWHLGLGSDFLSTYAYYLASPLNWLLVLCPKGLVIEFMTLSIWVKIALCGLFFFWLLVEKFQIKGIEGTYHVKTAAPALIFSTAYAFSGFVATYSWNIMWMDSIALAPLIILGLERLVKKNRPALYYVSLAVSILCNYYISLIICIFLVLYFGLLFLEQKSGKIKICVRFAWYSLLAGGTAAILLIPEALALGYTATANDGFPTTIKWYFGLVEELSRLCIAATPYTGTEHWPNLYCGVFTVFLVVLYCFNTRIKWTQKVPRVLLLVLFLLGFSNNVLNYIWHGLHFPNSLPGRQSFLFILMMMLMGYEGYCKRKGNKIWHVVVALLLCMVVLIVGSMKVESEIVEPVSFLLTGIFIVAYTLCFVAHRIGTKQMRLMIRGFAFGLALGEIILNMAITGFYSLDRTAYLQKTEDYANLLKIAEADAKMDANDGEIIFYRVEDYERKTKNDDSLYSYPSGTIFSSLTNIDVSHFYQSVYMEGGKNFYCYNGATPVVSSMLSVKYMLSDNAEGENDLRTIIGHSGEYYLYENKYCLPLGFMMREEAIVNWENSRQQKINSINNLGFVLGAMQNTLNASEAEVSIEEGLTTIIVPEDGIYYASYDSCNADNLTIAINGGAGTRYSKTTHKYLLELGQCEAGDVITISNAKESNVSFQLYQLNLEAVETAYETLSQQTMKLEEFADTTIKGSIDVSEVGRLVLSIPKEAGWMLYVDGKETETLDFKEAFLSVYLEEGTHSIELKYMTPGFKNGAIISGVCIGLFILTMWIRKRKQSE